jgi:putative iron-dependent peroxidase
VLEQMLTNMFVGSPPGTYDRILDFSTAMTGSLFFVPTIEFLDDPPTPTSAAADTQAPAGEIDGQAGEGSLRIGSLKWAPASQ